MRDEDLKQFGERLRLARKAKKINQRDLCVKIGYKANACISNVETGKMKIGVSKLKKIAAVLGVDLHYLITGEYYDNPKSAAYKTLVAKIAPDLHRYISELIGV